MKMRVRNTRKGRKARVNVLFFGMSHMGAVDHRNNYLDIPQLPSSEQQEKQLKATAIPYATHA
jgi:hypothetical protein